jgi:hypothetical protein
MRTLAIIAVSFALAGCAVLEWIGRAAASTQPRPAVTCTSIGTTRYCPVRRPGPASRDIGPDPRRLDALLHLVAARQVAIACDGVGRVQLNGPLGPSLDEGKVS